MFIQLSLIHNKLHVNVFLATIFECNFEPKLWLEITFLVSLRCNVRTLNKQAGNTVNKWNGDLPLVIKIHIVNIYIYNVKIIYTCNLSKLLRSVEV